MVTLQVVRQEKNKKSHQDLAGVGTGGKQSPNLIDFLALRLFLSLIRYRVSLFLPPASCSLTSLCTLSRAATFIVRFGLWIGLIRGLSTDPSSRERPTTTGRPRLTRRCLSSNDSLIVGDCATRPRFCSSPCLHAAPRGGKKRARTKTEVLLPRPTEGVLTFNCSRRALTNCPIVSRQLQVFAILPCPACPDVGRHSSSSFCPPQPAQGLAGIRSANPHSVVAG